MSGTIGPPQTPTTSDGIPVQNPLLCPIGTSLYVTGFGDDPKRGRGEGAPCTAEIADAGDAIVTVQFNDYVYLIGGSGFFTGAELGDWMDFSVIAPASVVVPNPGGAGNCNLVPVGPGMNMIIPSYGGPGAYDVDLSTAVPVPSYDEQTDKSGVGYWDWDAPTTGKGTITPGAPGTSTYYLLDFDKTLTRHAKLVVLGSFPFYIELPVQARRLLPQWKLVSKVHNEAGGHSLRVAFNLTTARFQTI
jgi:hypothetical protein